MNVLRLPDPFPGPFFNDLEGGGQQVIVDGSMALLRGVTDYPKLGRRKSSDISEILPPEIDWRIM